MTIGYVHYFRKAGVGRVPLTIYKALVTIDAPLQLAAKLAQYAWRRLRGRRAKAAKSLLAARGAAHFLARDVARGSGRRKPRRVRVVGFRVSQTPRNPGGTSAPRLLRNPIPDRLTPELRAVVDLFDVRAVVEDDCLRPSTSSPIKRAEHLLGREPVGQRDPQ